MDLKMVRLVNNPFVAISVAWGAIFVIGNDPSFAFGQETNFSQAFLKRRLRSPATMGLRRKPISI